MKNYKLTVQYDGTNYAGWQMQDNAVTVQQKISEAVEIIIKENINLIGSGRTDSGVHAIGQIANFKTDTEINIFRFQHSLNSILPPDISVKAVTKVAEKFHSRFDAKKRSYLYLLSLKKSPFYKNYSWLYFDEVKVDELNKLSGTLIGEHDFTSFSRKNSETENKSCTIYSAHWRKSGDIVYFFIEANRYLHGMVRTIVGTLLKLVKEEEGEKKLSEILNLKDRKTAGEAAPAKGLFLYKVKY